MRQLLLNIQEFFANDFSILYPYWPKIVGLLFFSYLCEWFLAAFILKKVILFIQKRKLVVKSEISKNFRFPLKITIFALSWILGVYFLKFPKEFRELSFSLAIILFNCGLVGTLYHLTDFIALYFEKKSITNKRSFDDILVPLLRKSAKFIIVILGIVFIGDSFNLNMTGMLTGLGIGGLAVALAAKDTLSNIIGSITILIDRPFEIGDWVTISSDIEGTVESVGFRSTSIRTFYDTLITIPNGQLVNLNINNFDKRQYRRYQNTLNFAYNTPLIKIETFCTDLKQYIINDPKIRKDKYYVNISNIDQFSYQVLINVFWEVPSYSEEVIEKEKFIKKIIQTLNKLEIILNTPSDRLANIGKNL